MLGIMKYKEAGVDIGAANKFVDAITPLAKSTSRKGVLWDIGGFGAPFAIGRVNYKDPVLVSSTDGVGTKLKIAFMMNKHDTIGIDLVAMNVNDIAVQGAEPLFFLDYIATAKLNMQVCIDIVKGVAEGCRSAGCALIGGETAQMHSLYKRGEYDLAGFVVGLVEREKIIDGSSINVGNSIIGVSSSGLHSNGYSLVRKIFFNKLKLNVSDYINELGCTLGEELIKPTRIYVKSILNIVKEFGVRGMAHITGGGIVENLPRILPRACQAVIKKGSWKVPPIFSLISKKGKVPEEEMFHTFNMGLGLIVIIPSQETEGVIERIKGMGEEACVIGEIVQRKEDEDFIRFVGNEHIMRRGHQSKTGLAGSTS